jgi:signal transduction histidine kinase/CheY-like chemotaxis protein
MRDWGIRPRVLFLALAPSLMILVTLVGYFTYARIAEVEVLLAQRGVSLARQLAPGTEFALFAGDRSTLERLASAATREADVIGVTISDAQGHVMARSVRNDQLDTREAIRFAQPVFATRLDPTDFPEQARADGAQPKIGEVAVTLSRASADARQRELLAVGLALGLAFVLVAVALAVFIGNGVVRPIRRLADAMAELTRGNRVAPLPVEGGGEFRTLSEGFNRMAGRLQADARELQRQIEEATSALTAQKDKAEQATTAKSRFIAAASHDLRQPLHAIRLFTSTLQRRARGPQLEELVQDLAKSVGVMDRLFDSLLDISRLDSGTLQAHPKPFRLDGLFYQLGAEYVEAAEQKHLGFRVCPTVAVVVSDELLLHRLLGNLVANAIRYTSEGNVMLCARKRGDTIRIEVRDSGIGISADKHEEIFQEFYQVGNPSRDRGHGLGLWLAIVSSLARLIGAEVLVRSAPGLGSTFSLRVPAGSARALPSIEALQSTQAVITSERVALPVLIVDDDPLVLTASKGMLEDLGCDVKTASDGTAAEAILTGMRNTPLLVICDLWLSDNQNGIEVLRRLTTLHDAALSGILITGDTSPEMMTAAKAAGYPLLHKPASPARLRAVVTQFAWKIRRTTDPGVQHEDTTG